MRHTEVIDTVMDPEDPQSRFRRLGPEALSDQELLDIFLNNGRSQRASARYASRVLETYGSVRSMLRAGYGELALELGDHRAARLCVANELIRRAMCERLTPTIALRSSRDVQRAYGPLTENTPDECIRVVLLDIRQRPLVERVVARGGASSCPVSVRDIFAMAVRESAAAMILIHNHPSGDPSPSEEDISLTRALAHAGEALGLPLIDHVILGQGSAFSFLDAGILPIDPSPESAQ